MKCKEIHKNIFPYVEGILNQTDSKIVYDHLQLCNICQQREKVVKEALMYIESEKKYTTDPFMFTRIQGKLSSASQASNLPGLIPKLLWATVISAALFAGVILGNSFSHGIKIVNDYKTEIYFLNDIHKENIETSLLSEEIN